MNTATIILMDAALSSDRSEFSCYRLSNSRPTSIWLIVPYSYITWGICSLDGLVQRRSTGGCICNSLKIAVDHSVAIVIIVPGFSKGDLSYVDRYLCVSSDFTPTTALDNIDSVSLNEDGSTISLRAYTTATGIVWTLYSINFITVCALTSKI